MKDFDYCFAENGLTAYKSGAALASQSFIGHVGEARYKKLVNFCLRELSEIDIPIKRSVLLPASLPPDGRLTRDARRGTFIEFRTGMIVRPPRSHPIEGKA